MAELKTKPNDADVEKFISEIADKIVREDCREIIGIMKRATNAAPKMWGASIVGFGDFHYKYESKRGGDTFLTGFSPRKANITLYLSDGGDWDEKLLANLGKHKTGKGCLYIKTLSDVDKNVLTRLIEISIERRK